MTDVFLKDEGDFITVGFQSEKAKAIAPSMMPREWLYGDGLLKADIAIESLDYTKEALTMNGLTFEEC